MKNKLHGFLLAAACLSLLAAVSDTRLSGTTTFVGPTAHPILLIDVNTSTDDFTPDLDDGSVFILDLENADQVANDLNATLNPVDGAVVQFWVVQDTAPADRTLAWNAIYHFAGGTDPTATATANAVDQFGCTYSSTLTMWACSSNQDLQ